jgi:RND family efflux transporter MFP subunit
MKTSTKTNLFPLALLAGLFVSQALLAQEVARDNSGKVSVVTQTRVAMTEVIPGSIVPDQQSKIASRLMGYIRNLNIQVGQSVKEGQLLFAIDPTDINSQIRQAQSAVAQARAALADAKADYERFSKLYKQQSVPQQQFDKMKLQYQVAQENLSAAEAGYEQAKGQMRYADVKAPFDGVVVQKLAVTGDLAAPGNPVLILENRQLMSVQVEVSSDLYRLLKLGDVADVTIEGREGVVSGVISNLVAAANPITRTHTVKLSLSGAPVGINSGAFARVAFKRGDRTTMLVPASAVLTRGGIVGLFVVGADDVARFRMVRTGLMQGDNVEIQAGLELGEKVLLSSAQPARNGDHIVSGGQ